MRRICIIWFYLRLTNRIRNALMTTAKQNLQNRKWLFDSTTCSGWRSVFSGLEPKHIFSNWQLTNYSLSQLISTILFAVWELKSFILAIMVCHIFLPMPNQVTRFLGSTLWLVIRKTTCQPTETTLTMASSPFGLVDMSGWSDIQR